MGKELVTIDNLDDFICKNDGKFYMDGTRIITPGAKDALISRHVEIVYGSGCGHAGQSCAAACGAGHDSPVLENEDLLIAVAATLRSEYGITDNDKLRAMTLEVVKTLRESLSTF